MCEGSVDDLVGRPIFLALYPYFLKYGGVFKLAFGPKVFMVLSDPVIVREVLKEKPFAFSKGVLAEILEPIMGQGLIPAPYAVWKNRRRQLVPGFHKAWLDHMVGLFGGGARRGFPSRVCPLQFASRHSPMFGALSRRRARLFFRGAFFYTFRVAPVHGRSLEQTNE